MSKSNEGEYTVGYGKPPEQSRFQKGHSGNPKGRPKGSLSMAAALDAALKERVVVIENHRRKSITKLQAAVKGLVNRAVKGDARATQQLLALGPLVGTESPRATQALDAHDAEILQGLLKHFEADANPPSQP